MKVGKRFRPSPSLVISCIALFVALSGSAVALQGKNSVDSGDIKPGAVHTSDIQDGFATDPGKIGSHTIVGANIDNGTIKAQKLAGVHVVKSSTFIDDFTTFDAQCPAGELLTGGGVQLDGSDTTTLLASGPDLSDNAPRSWFAQASSSVNFGSMSVFAVCLK
jgi:hypothetical protein